MTHEAISKTSKRGHNIMELVYILTNFSITLSEMERDYQYVACITSWKMSIFRINLVRIFQHLNLMWRDTPYLLVFSPNVEKYEPE